MIMKPSMDSIGKSDRLQASLNCYSVGAKKTEGEKRAYPRRYFSVPLEISHINKENKSDGQLINHCEDGMCIRSKTKYNPGMSLVVRVKNFTSNELNIESCEGLRTINLVDVKWCQEILDTDKPYFKVGLQFHAPAY